GCAAGGASSRPRLAAAVVPLLLANARMSLQWVDLETARGARGVRLVVAGALPSPWSEAAKALVHVKQIPALAVRYLRSRDQEDLAAWTGARNVPVVLYDDEP